MIRVTLDGAAVGTGRAAALPPVSASFAPGVPTVVATEGGIRPTVLSLAASGRMKLDAGSVTAVELADDGDGDAHDHVLRPAALRRAIALIDTPLVADHSDEVSIATVVREELALAGVRGSRVELSVDRRDRHPFGSLGGADRLRLLIELALLRPDVAALVITSPERHGGEPALWWRVVRETAARGIAVLVVTDAATLAHLERLPEPEPDTSVASDSPHPAPPAPPAPPASPLAESRTS